MKVGTSRVSSQEIAFSPLQKRESRATTHVSLMLNLEFGWMRRQYPMSVKVCERRSRTGARDTQVDKKRKVKHNGGSMHQT